MSKETRSSFIGTYPTEQDLRDIEAESQNFEEMYRDLYEFDSDDFILHVE